MFDIDRSSAALFRLAATSTDPDQLAELAHNPSHFIRARVAGNQAIHSNTHEALLVDKHHGVVLWAIENKHLTRNQFETVFQSWQPREYNWLIHPALARHSLASVEELSILLKRNQWLINMAVLNNHEGRDHDEYKACIKPLMPTLVDGNTFGWSEQDFLADYRYYGTRRRKTMSM